MKKESISEAKKPTIEEIANKYTMLRFKTASSNGMDDFEFFNHLKDDIKAYACEVLDYAREIAIREIGLNTKVERSILAIKEQIKQDGKEHQKRPYFLRRNEGANRFTYE